MSLAARPLAAPAAGWDGVAGPRALASPHRLAIVRGLDGQLSDEHVADIAHDAAVHATGRGRR